MNKKTSYQFAVIFMLCAVSCTAYIFLNKTGHEKSELKTNVNNLFRLSGESDKIKSKASSLKNYAVNNNYNQELCFLIDMSISSGKNRFFVYDLKKDSVISSGLVTHGRCNQLWLEERKYSNVPGCGCTSLGKYEIGFSYTGRFGLAYKLYGLDSSNSNAFKRYIVLHAHECVPENEITGEICQSDGCPTVSPGFLRQLIPLNKSSKIPILLWIFE